MAKAKTSPTSSPGAASLLLAADSPETSLPVWLAAPPSLDADLKPLSPAQRNWLEATGWTADAGAVALLPGEDGALAGAVLGLGEEGDAKFTPLAAGALPGALPEGAYHFASGPGDANLAALGWTMGAYRFTRYKKSGPRAARKLKLPRGADAEEVARIADAVWRARDLINTPASDFGPEELEQAVRAVAKRHGGKVSVTTGEALLKENFPMIHAVGRASDRPPRLIDMRWGGSGPRVTLVGKGICYDTGGLSLKPTAAMLLMKKDMGGAATALALAEMIMGARLKMRLRLLIPAADNNISANSFRPGDVLQSRNGMTVEIGNTDAEGRLVLGDALALADEEKPEHLMTFATLTGAARVALGPELPAFYSTDDKAAQAVIDCAGRIDDPVWRMPFWGPYDALLKAKTGDVCHISDGPFAGSVTAALFLKRFVTRAERYMHLDLFAWVRKARPGKPEGAEPQGARAMFDYFRARYG